MVFLQYRLDPHHTPEVDALIIPVLQMRLLRLRGLPKVAQPEGSLSQELNPGLLDPRPRALNRLCISGGMMESRSSHLVCTYFKYLRASRLSQTVSLRASPQPRGSAKRRRRIHVSSRWRCCPPQPLQSPSPSQINL